MKYYTFRKDWNGFLDWIASIRYFRWTIRSHEAGTKNDKEYTEANYWYVNYLAYMKGLNERQKEFIKYKGSGHIPPYGLCHEPEIDFMFERWLEVVANTKLNSLEEISNKEVGAAIKKARLLRCMNRVQVAGLIGIGVNTLKCYEEGRRTLPLDVYYKLIQLFEFDVGVIHIK